MSGLAASLAAGAAAEAVRRTGSGSDASAPMVLSDANIRRLVSKLSQMRGAALKLGQFASIQGMTIDSHLLPPQIQEVFRRVQNMAHSMPFWQTQRVLTAELGADWRDRFDAFDEQPFASASIGQVHRATLRESDSRRVVVKVQFPGVQRSIDSDLDNLAMLLSAAMILPRGLFLDKTIRVMRGELADECNYELEAAHGRRFARLLADDPAFRVPRVVSDLTTSRVLVTDELLGEPLDRATQYDQETRDRIGSLMLRLCLRELFHFQSMQTDPNWTNFFFNRTDEKIELLDFGATRTYSTAFVDSYLRVLLAAVEGRRDDCVTHSRAMGYLTPDEDEEMIEAHVESLLAVAEPFRATGVYDFARQQITDRVRRQVPTMLRLRKTPPPVETYSLNRKLSGVFLLCARLGSRVDCATLLRDVLADRDKQVVRSDQIRAGA